MKINRNFIRVTCLVCGTVLFITYAITGANGTLTGVAGTLIGIGIDVLKDKSDK